MANTRKQPAKTPEFPILDANALYASDIKGDGEFFFPLGSSSFRPQLTTSGNCLFNALSDQLYGHQGEHGSLRDATIAHMRINSEFYRQYMIVKPVRRNPKRKTNKALAPPIDFTFHTEEELQRQFDVHVEKMGQPGEWADNMEVSAFASALNVHVRLWQADFHYTFSPRVYYASNNDLSADHRPVLNIAYHVSLSHRLRPERALLIVSARPGSTTLLSGTSMDHTRASPASPSTSRLPRRRSAQALRGTMRASSPALRSVVLRSRSSTPTPPLKVPRAHPTSPTRPKTRSAPLKSQISRSSHSPRSGSSSSFAPLLPLSPLEQASIPHTLHSQGVFGFPWYGFL